MNIWLTHLIGNGLLKYGDIEVKFENVYNLEINTTSFYYTNFTDEVTPVFYGIDGQYSINDFSAEDQIKVKDAISLDACMCRYCLNYGKLRRIIDAFLYGKIDELNKLLPHESHKKIIIELLVNKLLFMNEDVCDFKSWAMNADCIPMTSIDWLIQNHYKIEFDGDFGKKLLHHQAEKAHGLIADFNTTEVVKIKGIMRWKNILRKYLGLNYQLEIKMLRQHIQQQLSIIHINNIKRCLQLGCKPTAEFRQYIKNAKEKYDYVDFWKEVEKII